MSVVEQSVFRTVRAECMSLHCCAYVVLLRRGIVSAWRRPSAISWLGARRCAERGRAACRHKHSHTRAAQLMSSEIARAPRLPPRRNQSRPTMHISICIRPSFCQIRILNFKVTDTQQTNKTEFFIVRRLSKPQGCQLLE